MKALLAGLSAALAIFGLGSQAVAIEYLSTLSRLRVTAHGGTEAEAATLHYHYCIRQPPFWRWQCVEAGIDAEDYAEGLFLLHEELGAFISDPKRVALSRYLFEGLLLVESPAFYEWSSNNIRWSLETRQIEGFDAFVEQDIPRTLTALLEAQESYEEDFAKIHYGYELRNGTLELMSTERVDELFDQANFNFQLQRHVQ